MTCVPAEALTSAGAASARWAAWMRVGLPEVGRMDAVGARERLHFAVLREQRQRRQVLAGQAAAQEIEQRERRAFDRGGGGAVELAHLLREADHRLLAGAQHAGALDLADHVERTGALVEQRAGLLQRRRGRAVDLGALRRGLGVAHLACATPCARCPGYGEARRPPRPTCSGLQALRALLVHSTSSPARALASARKGVSHHRDNGPSPVAAGRRPTQHGEAKIASGPIRAPPRGAATGGARGQSSRRS